MQQQLTLPGLALGCWPLAGMTRPGVTRQAVIETVAAAIDHGIAHLEQHIAMAKTVKVKKAIAQAAQADETKSLLRVSVASTGKLERSRQ